MSSQTKPLLTEIRGVKEGLSAYAGGAVPPPGQIQAACFLRR